jgi:hypothetical protein
MLNKIKELNNMKNKAKKIEHGLYEYRGFSIKRIDASYTFWNIAEIPASGDIYDAHEAHDATNTIAEAKEFIDKVYFRECA